MSKLRLSITMSLDGYVAGPDQDEESPLGSGGLDLHEWFFPLKAFREMHGEEGGAVNASSAVVEERWANVGATIMGRYRGARRWINQYMAAGLVDEIDISIAPLILGTGERLFAGLDRGTFKLEQIRAVDAPGVTHIKYAVS